MTTTITPTITPVPVKTEGQSWEDFAEAIKTASEAEEARLMNEVPTPPITAERGTDAWGEEWKAQYNAGHQRTDLLMKFNSRLVLEVGKAVASVTPNFRSFEVEYAGEGDSGEACVISVYINNTYRTRDAEGRYVPPTQEQTDAFDLAYRTANDLLPEGLTAWVDETCWAIAYDQHPGFEIDAGGYGQIVVAPADEDDDASPLQLTISHTERVEQSYEDQVLA